MHLSVPQLLKSKTFWSIISLVAVNSLPVVSDHISPDYKPLLNSVIGTVGVVSRLLNTQLPNKDKS